MQNLMKRLHKNQKGFTLVELMVVVVIIGILVAIAIPIYNLVTDRADEAATEANDRIILGARSMYEAVEGSPPANDGLLVPDYLEEEPDPNTIWNAP